MCRDCGTQFVLRKQVDLAKLWKEYAHEHATLPVLAERYGKSIKWVRTKLDEYELPKWQPTPRTMNAVMDATYTGDSVFVVVRDERAKENVWCKEFSTESPYAYQIAYKELIKQGFNIASITGDGRVALQYLFPDTPVQMCHFHQKQIIIQCVTLNPKLEAGKEILALIETLSTTNEETFTKAFNAWCLKWHDFLNERTVSPETGRKPYTHRKLRRARTSITTHLPFLFTYLKFSELNIPNTSNSLEGTFAKVKTARRVHSGLRRARLVKLLLSLLRK